MTDHSRRNDFVEGPQAATRFQNFMGRLLKVSKDEFKKREAAYKESRKAHRRKRKTA